jgi:hypothetical protein
MPRDWIKSCKEMGTIPIDPLDDAGNEGGISGSSEPDETGH